MEVAALVVAIATLLVQVIQAWQSRKRPKGRHRK